MPAIKPKLETIARNFGSSFALRRHDQPCHGNTKFWHFHPEIEMVYIKTGSGKRHIGNHLSYFQNGDLVLIGSNLPHSGFSNRLSGNQEEIVLQMLPDFLGPDFFDAPEMTSIKHMLTRSKQGISFYGKTREVVGNILDTMPELPAFDRLISLMNVLQTLSASKEYKILNANMLALETTAQNQERMKLIFEFVQKEFSRAIALEEVAALVNLTVPSFCRYFKEITDKTFTSFVNEYRVVHASKLLAEGQLSIAEVCYECGFNNYSHFTKQFKLYTEKSPGQYREEMQHIFA